MKKEAKRQPKKAKETATKREWEIRLDAADNTIGFNLDRGTATVHKGAVYVRYRPLGSRGRFTSFTLIGGLPKGVNWSDVVERHASGAVKAA
jgi:hypothetical protein